MSITIESRDYASQRTRIGAQVPRILVVEDDPDFAEVVRVDLEHGGYVVELVTSVEEAQERMRGMLVPDLILSDVRLRDGSGVELLVSTSGERTHLPVVMMSGFVTRELREFVLWSGSIVLQKPFSFGLLHACVIRALMKRIRAVAAASANASA